VFSTYFSTLLSMSHVVLKGSGAKMPSVGFGCWKVTRETCADTIYNAIKAGYRMLDSAADYGNEVESGQGLKRAIDEGIVKREEIFVTSKVWQNFHAKEHVHQLVKKQLADWQLDYFDLFMIHFPISLEYIDPKTRYPPGWFGDDGEVHVGNVPIQETWEAMEELVDLGLAKDIGLSNFPAANLLDVLRYNKKPVSVLQIEHHPYLTQEALVSLCRYLGIAIIGYCSFGPQSWVELDEARGAASLLTDNETINAIAAATGKSTAQVLLRWSTQRGIVVIPKSNKQGRLIQNLQCNDFDLTNEQINAISALNINLRFNDPATKHTMLSVFA